MPARVRAKSAVLQTHCVTSRLHVEAWVVGSEAEPERVQCAYQVGFELIEVSVAQFRDGPPPDLGEFALVRMQGLSGASGEGGPRG
jgi:hypothetical protein